MAQILKDESRNAIIEAAKEEFLENGYKNASMRRIAKKSNMTVGNLYRYFKSKEDINEQIVSSTFKEIDNVLKTITADNVSMEARVFNIKANVDELHELMNNLADSLIDIYYHHKIEFNILMMNSKLNQSITDWFSKAIISLINQHFSINGYLNEKEVLSRSYATSIFAGVKEIFKSNNLDKDSLSLILKTYLNSYLSLLDSDIRKLVD